MYTHISIICLHKFIHIHICIYSFVYACVYIDTCVQKNAYIIYVYVYSEICIPLYTYVCICLCVCTFTFPRQLLLYWMAAWGRPFKSLEVGIPDYEGIKDHIPRLFWILGPKSLIELAGI